MVIWVKTLKTEKSIEIHLVRLTEVCGEVLSEKYDYKSVKTALLFLRNRYKSKLSIYRPTGGYWSRGNLIGSNRANVAKSSVRSGFEYTFSL